MVDSGIGHDRCPSGFPEPIRRPGATLRWRLRNYKNRFWFQEGVKFFLDLDRLAVALRQRGHGHLEGSPFAVSYCGPAHGEDQLSLLLLPTGVLGLRALFQCGPLGRDGLVEAQRGLIGLHLLAMRPGSLHCGRDRRGRVKKLGYRDNDLGRGKGLCKQ